jgi:TIR domain/Ras family
MAGQPGYRLVHQLHLNEVSLALIVFDARSETDPFSGVRHWDRALRQAQRIQEGSAPPLAKFLVVARTDRGGIGVGNTRMKRLLNELSIDTYIETSAKEGKNIKHLSDLIKEAVPWNLLPKVRSTELFQRIKNFILTEKKAGRLLTNGDDFYRTFLKIEKLEDSNALHAQFDACIGRVESRDLIKRLSFGNLVLLQPELLDVYASAMVNAAKEEPDGLGCISEEDASSGRFPMPSEDRLNDAGLERLLLIATVESLLKHEIAFKEASHEGVQLVFPSQFTREHPDLPDPQGKTATITFEGPVVAIYATLAVRLSRSSLFLNKDMWRNAAVFQANVGGTCGMVLREIEEGRGELTLFFSPDTSRDSRFHFEEYIYTHLRRWAIPETIVLKRIVTCLGCGLVFTDQFIKLMAEKKVQLVKCQVCDTTVSLLSEEESLTEVPPSVVSEMDQAADSGRDLEAAAIVLSGKIATGDFDVFLCHNSNDKKVVIELANRLKERGILPWLDVWEIRPGHRWQRELEQNVTKAKAAVVIFGKKGLGPWQDMEEDAILADFVRRKAPVIPVILADCKKDPTIPLFLQGIHHVDFRRDYPDPFEQLVWGILGTRPNF